MTQKSATPRQRRATVPAGGVRVPAANLEQFRTDVRLAVQYLRDAAVLLRVGPSSRERLEADGVTRTADRLEAYAGGAT